MPSTDDDSIHARSPQEASLAATASPRLPDQVDPAATVIPPAVISPATLMTSPGACSGTAGANPLLPAVPGYKVIEEIARGGMGVVYRAHDPVFDREVAIKIMHAGQHAGRFIVESRITARLPHPGVPPVYALGRLTNGRPFLVMKLIRGRTLADELEAVTPVDLTRLLGVFEQISQTVGFAHAQGIIHRDLKPSNVMVGAFGEVQVMDWGLAREEVPGPSSPDIRDDNSGDPCNVLSNDEGQMTKDNLDRRPIKAVVPPSSPSPSGLSAPIVTATVAGQVKGTPAYMAPEQARGESVDARADVFALGGILVAMLTGKPPFMGESVVDTWQKAYQAELGDCFSRLEGSSADPELLALARRCLAALPADRPATGAAVAEVVAAYRAGVEDRLRKAEQERAAADARAAEQRKRQRVQWALFGTMLLLLAAGGVGIGFASLWRTAEAAKASAEGAKDDAEQQRGLAIVARDQLDAERKKLAILEYGWMVQLAHQAWRDNDLAAARSLLERTNPDLRGWEYGHVHRLSHTELAVLKGHTDPLQSASFSPDGSRVVTASYDSTARVWDARTGAETALLKGHAQEVYSASFSPDGSRVVTASYDNTARVWDAKTGAEIAVLKGHTIRVHSASFSPDGSRVVTAGWDNTSRLWDAKTGAEYAVLKGHTDGVRSASFSPDGLRVVTASLDRTARVWDAKTGAEVIVLKGHTGGVRSASFSPDGLWVVTASLDRTARVWDAKTGAEVTVLKGHTGPVLSASFSPDGSRVVTAGSDDSARLWDAASGAESAVLKGHTASFSADGLWLVTASDDNNARVWDALTGAEIAVLKGHTDMVPSALFSPDGSRVVTASYDSTARVWDARESAQAAVLKGHTSSVYSASFNPDGSRLVTASGDSTAWVWDTKTGAQVVVLKGHTNQVDSASFSSDGSRIVTASDDNTARLWDAKTGAQVAVFKGHTDVVSSASFNPDGSRVVTASYDTTARVWDVRTGTEAVVLKGHKSSVYSASFSPDGSRVVTASGDSTARVWDASTGAQVAVLKGHTDQVNSASFSSDGSRIVTASDDSTARLWDAKTGAEIAVLKGHTNAVNSASFSPDGSRVVTASWDNTARVWDVKIGAELVVLKGHTGIVNSALFSPDGSRVVTASSDRTARVWDSRPFRDTLPPETITVPPPRETRRP